MRPSRRLLEAVKVVGLVLACLILGVAAHGLLTLLGMTINGMTR